MSVRAFQPRKYDPPKFVAEDLDGLEEREGEYIGGGQCDGCGSAVFQIRARRIDNWAQWEAVCCNDPDDEFQHPDPCGAIYPITVWDDDLVEF